MAKTNEELLTLIEDLVDMNCKAWDLETGEEFYDSRKLKVYDDAMRELAAAGRLQVKSDVEGRIRTTRSSRTTKEIVMVP